MAYTPTESNRPVYSSASDTLRRMSDSQIENISKKLQEYIALKFWESNWNSYSSGSPTSAAFGSFWMSSTGSYNPTGGDAISKGTLNDTSYTAVQTSDANNDEPIAQPEAYAGDDDDSYSDPGNMTVQTNDTYGAWQREYSDYTNFRLTGNIESGLTAGDLNRYWGYVKSNDTTGHLQSEGDAATVRDMIFKNINDSIRSTDTTGWGRYKLSSSDPSTVSDTGYSQVSNIGGFTQYGLLNNYSAFVDRISSVAAPTATVSELDNTSIQNSYYLWLKWPRISNFTGDKENPMRSHRFKITKVSGTEQDDEGSDAGLNDYFAYGDYDGAIGSFFYIKVQATSGNYYISSDLTNPTDSSSYGGTIYSANYDNTNGTLYPSGNSTNGFVRILKNPRFAGSYTVNTIYKVEKVSMMREIKLPDMSRWSSAYDYTTWAGYGSSATDYNGQASYRNDLQNSLFLIHYLYKWYTYGRYHVRYAIETSNAGTGEYNHGVAYDTRKGTIDEGTVDGPTLIGSTYYTVRYSSGSLVTQNSYYLNSTSDV